MREDLAFGFLHRHVGDVIGEDLVEHAVHDRFQVRVVYVEQQHDSGWTLGRKTNKGGLFVERGWFPYDFCRPIKL